MQQTVIIEGIGENDLNLVESDRLDSIGDITFKGMAIGMVEKVDDFYLFSPFVEFDPDEMDCVDGDDLDELMDRVDNEVNQCYDLLDYRASNGWSYYS